MKQGPGEDALGVSSHRIVVNNEAVVFSSPITMLTDASKRFEKGLCLTDKALYLLEDLAPRRRIPLGQIDALTVSQMSMEFVVHVRDSYDLRLSSPQRRNDIIERLLFLVCNSKLGSKFLKFYEVPQLNLVGVMTTENLFKNKKRQFPPEATAKAIDYQKYEQQIEAMKNRSCLMRQKTRILVQNSPNKVAELSIDDFELIQLLGRGNFGSVFLGRKKGDARLYAIKRISKAEIIQNDQLLHTKAEKDILAHVNHAFLVKLVYAFQTGANLYFVTEFMKGGELTHHLRKAGTFPESQARFYTACVVLALAHLHNKDFVYRDLKLENLLMDEQGYVRITDFGLAKLVPADATAETFCGTPEYIAPEIVAHKGHDRMVDWWTLGVLVYFFLFGKPPFFSLNANLLYKKILEDEVVFPSTPKVSDKARDFILKLLNKDPRKRLGSAKDSAEVLAHPWMAAIDVTRVLERSLPAPVVPETEGDKWEQNFDDELIQERFRRTELNEPLSDLSAFQKEFDAMNFCIDSRK